MLPKLKEQEMKLIIFCDPPLTKPGHNVGGLQSVISHTVESMRNFGHVVTLITAEMFTQVPPSQDAYAFLCDLLSTQDFDTVHIATANRLGFLARRYCVERGLQFTCTYDTQLCEYLHLRHGVPLSISYAFLRWYMAPASKVVTPTPSMQRVLEGQRIQRVVANAHGVDTELFQPLSLSPMSNPATQAWFDSLPRPVLLYVGRVSPEKSPQDFLNLRFGGMAHSKVVVGGVSGGLTLEALQALDPSAHFVGVKTGADLADYYKGADVFVFPSKTDTFGLVQLEALAAGVPVAAYPVVGSTDVITDSRVGCLNADLEAGVAQALQLSRQDCRAFAMNHSWCESIGRFESHLVRTLSQGPCTAGSTMVWNDMTWEELEKLVDDTAMLLFGGEPAGPFDPKKKAALLK